MHTFFTTFWLIFLSSFRFSHSNCEISYFNTISPTFFRE